MVPQFKHLWQQADSIATTFAQLPPLQHSLAWPHYHVVAFPPVLPPSHLFLQDSKSTNYPKALQGLLPKLGIVCFFPLLLCHALSSLFGLALPSIFWEQGIAVLCLLLEYANGPSVAGSLILTLVKQAQMEVGSITPFFQLPFQQYGDQLLA